MTSFAYTVPDGDMTAHLRCVRRLAGAVIPVLAALLMLPPAPAAAQQRGLSLQVPANPSSLLPVPPRPPALTPPASPFEPAPLPNRDVEQPAGPRASNAPSVAPSLFTRSDSYRGEGYARGSTAQTEQERKVKPGAGFNLRVPFAPN